MLIRLPSQGGIAAHTLRPFPYPVLWSIDPDVVTIERFNRLNDPKGEQHVLDNLRQIARRRPHTDATTWSPSMTRDCEKAAAAIRAALAEPQGREWWAAVIESARHGPYLADTLHTSRDAALTSGGGMHRVIDAVRLA